MSTERLMAKLRELAKPDMDYDGNATLLPVVAKLALALLPLALTDHEWWCNDKSGLRCSCPFVAMRAALATAERELCGGGDVQEGR